MPYHAAKDGITLTQGTAPSQAPCRLYGFMLEPAWMKVIKKKEENQGGCKQPSTRRLFQHQAVREVEQKMEF